MAEVVSDGRVVYVDKDERVVARGGEILADVAGATAIQADVRGPEAILNHPETRRLIDFDEPVGLLLVAVTQFVPDEDDPWGMVASYVGAITSGSYLALSAPTSDFQAKRIIDSVAKVYAATPTPARARSKEEIERFFEGLELVPPYEGGTPGVAYAGEWGAEDVEAADSDGSRWFYAAVARKP